MGDENIARVIELRTGWAVDGVLGARQGGLEAEEDPGCGLGLERGSGRGRGVDHVRMWLW